MVHLQRGARDHQSRGRDCPVDVAMSRLPVDEVRAKGVRAVDQLEALVGPLRGKTFEIHAGSSYVRSITAPLGKRGAILVNPLERLRFGYQLQWYDRQAGVTKPAKRAGPGTSSRPALGARAAPSLPPSLIDAEVVVEEVSELEPFDFRWPEGPEYFDRGWDFAATIGSARFRARHGIGGREVYGRYRVHSVTWLDGQSMVEGVAADDYAQSDALLSTLRIRGEELSVTLRTFRSGTGVSRSSARATRSSRSTAGAPSR